MIVGVSQTGCDSTASLYLSEVQFDELYVMSAVPMKKISEDGEVRYEPLCRMQDEAADGLILRVLLKGTQQKEGADLDQSIRPGDRIDLQEVTETKINPERFELSFSCIEQQFPGAARCKTSADCAQGELCDPSPGKGFCVDGLEDCYSGIQTGNVAISRVGFKEFTPSRAEPVGVAILVDMSGSNKGFVKPFPPYYEVDNEDPTGKNEDALQNFADRASDLNGTRFSAVETIIENLNDRDRVIVFGYREYGIDVFCVLPGDEGADNDTKKDNCYGPLSKVRSLYLAEEGFDPIDDFKTDVGGRSPLWTAVDQVYDYMENHSQTAGTKYKHIIVINDGPDTCTESSSLDQCSGSCAQFSTSFETVRDMVEAVDYGERIPVHFLQYQAMGYLDRDPRQQEIACLTGGHHMFLNSDEFAQEHLTNMFQDTARQMRYTFGGYWEFAIEMTKLGEDASLPPGWNYGVAGTGKLLALADHFMIQEDHHFTFDVDGEAKDSRVSLRKDCTSDGDCPGDEEASVCTTRKWWCDDEALECTGAVEWADNGTGGDGCGDVDAVVRVQIRDIAGGTGTETKEVSLGDLPSFCCNGACTPPMPPVVPDDLARDGGTICFEYDDEKGWTFEEDGQEWVYWAELYVKPGCQPWTAVKPALAYGVNENPAIGDLTWELHWNCPDRQNCFPPPGAGD